MIVSRERGKEIAQDTIGILQAGVYQSPSGSAVEIRTDLKRAVSTVRMYSSEELEDLLEAITNGSRFGTQIEVKNETSLQAAERLAREATDEVACLNFASAHSPGGGFLNGARAQEESLARSSGLYPTLMTQQAYRDCQLTAHAITPENNVADTKLEEEPAWTITSS